MIFSLTALPTDASPFGLVRVAVQAKKARSRCLAGNVRRQESALSAKSHNLLRLKRPDLLGAQHQEELCCLFQLLNRILRFA